MKVTIIVPCDDAERYGWRGNRERLGQVERFMQLVKARARLHG